MTESYRYRYPQALPTPAMPLCCTYLQIILYSAHMNMRAQAVNTGCTCVSGSGGIPGKSGQGFLIAS